ncbi:FtsB/FtsL family cell division protein [Paenibacillus swuensis]|uniref:hypothetical protein n=1 Tax=Paenibacillus swuensis TaxID=1178515 RepID=UPI000838A31E|nr:hypothetical protein [Paenibacillus swuensis]
MPAYIHGNLAVNPNPKRKKATRIRETTTFVVRKKISTQEKLLYLFTIVACVLVAGVIIFRYAQIYEMNLQLQTVEKEIKVLQTENSKMKLKLEAMMNPAELEKRALQEGFTKGQSDSKEYVVPNKNTGSEGVALTE